MDNIFNSVKLTKPARNLFDLSFDNKSTVEFGELVPVLLQEMLPGDEVRLKQEVYVRLMPTLSPILHKVDVYLHTFFVPNRLIYDRWNDFLTGEVNDDAAHTPLTPPHTHFEDLGMVNRQLYQYGLSVFSPAPLEFTQPDPSNVPVWNTSYSEPAYPLGFLSDYLGLPTSVKDNYPCKTFDSLPISLLPFRAYQLIYNEYYRDENLIPELDFSREGGYFDSVYFASNMYETFSLFMLRHRAWRKDYFTASLPWTQKGAQVILPLGSSAPLTGNPSFAFANVVETGDRHWLTYNPATASGSATGGTLAIQDFSADGDWSLSRGSLQVDLSHASSASINDFRVALRVQEWLEKNARCGSRYIEQILAHFGVMTPDARLQRPEFLGGSKATLTVTEVLQSSPYDPDKGNYTPVGLPAGKVTGYDNNSDIHYYCYEHGYLMTIASVMPKANYYQGIPRHWTRTSLMDFYWPEFANLGEQGTFNHEIFVPFAASANQSPGLFTAYGDFGYMPRYMEYRCNQDTIHCDFRDSLDFWHLARQFNSAPALNEFFIDVFAVRDGLDRIFSVTTSTNGKHILMEVFNDFKALRPLPVYAVPSLA